jgi:hypothetical protein
MNDDVLVHIGQYADADARRAMGLSPNRLPPSNDGRYDYLHKMLARERSRYCWSGDNGISNCSMWMRAGDFSYGIQWIKYDNGKETSWTWQYNIVNSPSDLWTIHLEEDGALKSSCYPYPQYMTQNCRFVWQDGRWVRMDW